MSYRQKFIVHQMLIYYQEEEEIYFEFITATKNVCGSN